MPEKDLNQAGAAGEKPGRRKPLTIILIMLVLILAGAGGVYGYYTYFGPDKKETTASAKHNSSEKELASLDLGDMIVNLAGSEGNHYLKIKITIEYMPDKNIDRLVTEQKHHIIDAILFTLRQKNVDDVRPPEATEQLKQELISAVNNRLNEKVIKKIYFTEYIVQ